MKITQIKTQWPEPKGHVLTRQDIGNEYIFLHFLTPAVLTLHGEFVRVEKGGCILYDKHSYQQFRVVDSPLLHDWFHLEGELDGWTKEYGLDYSTVYEAADSHAVTGLLQTLEREFLKAGPFSERFCALKIEELLIALSRSRLEVKGEMRIDAQLKKQLCALRTAVHTAYQQDWPVKRMAAEICLSESHFYHVYQHLFGISPKQDLLETRIEHAKYLLMEEGRTVEQVAALCGFTNPYHFIRQFKARTGVTPGRYADNPSSQ